MSGSGSLHSWNLEAPEEKSVSESLSASQEQESEQTEVTKLEDVKEAIERHPREEEIAESNNSEEEGKGEEEETRANHEIRVSSEEDGNKPEFEKELIRNSEDKENWTMEEDRSNQMMKDLPEQPQQRENQEEEKEKTEAGPLHQNTDEERQEQEVDVQPADSQSHVNEESPQKASDEAETRPLSPAPKVLSAVAHFQSQGLSQGFQVNSRTKEPAGNQTRLDFQPVPKVQTLANKLIKSSDEEEEMSPLIKVSELKKRFEA